MKTFVFLIVAAILFVAQTLPALAQKEHIEFYKQFNEALEAGDFAAAEEAGERAWRTAETELGDSQTTAVLAYNYAAQIYFSTPEKAIEPLERVIEIAGEGSGLFGAEPPALMLAFVRAATNDTRNLKSALRERLEAFDVGDTELTLLSARGWFHITRYEMDRERFSRAEDAASASLHHYEAFREFAPREYANVLIARGISNVAGSSRSEDDLIDANIDFTEAIQTFPPQRDIETFDPLLAAAVAWISAVRSAAASDFPGRPRLGSRFRRDPPELEGESYVEWTTPNRSYEECNIVWKKRTPPRFPASASLKGYLGATLIGFHLKGTKVSDARILGEVPQRSEFGEVTLKAMEEWEIEKEPTDPNCARNRLQTMRFQFAN